MPHIWSAHRQHWHGHLYVDHRRHEPSDKDESGDLDLLTNMTVQGKAVDVKPNETAPLSLSVNSGGAALGTSSTALTSQNDDFEGGVAFTSEPHQGNENIVSVPFSTTDACVLNGTDVVASSGVQSWADQETSSKTFQVVMLNNTAFQGRREFGIQLAAAPGRVGFGTRSVLTVMMTNDESRAFGLPNLL